MKIVLVELYSATDDDFLIIEALVDTGASLCVIPDHIRQWLGLPLSDRVHHMWQVRDPIAAHSTTVRLRVGERQIEVEAVTIEIPESFLRPATADELGHRPTDAHPLAMRIVFGDNLFTLLSDAEREELGLRSNWS